MVPIEEMLGLWIRNAGVERNGTAGGRMRSTTGKLIRFTLQRTPTWAWAGPIVTPKIFYGIDPATKDSWGCMVAIEVARGGVLVVKEIKRLKK